MPICSSGDFIGWHKVVLFAIPLLMWPQLYTARPSWLERLGCCLVLTVSSTLDSAHYMNLVVDDSPGATEAWPITADDFVMMALVRFLHADERAVL